MPTKRKREDVRGDVYDELVTLLDKDLVVPIKFLPNGAVEIKIRDHTSLAEKTLRQLLAIRGVVDAVLLKDAPPDSLALRLMRDYEDERFKRVKQAAHAGVGMLSEVKYTIKPESDRPAVTYLIKASRKPFPLSHVSHHDNVLSLECTGDVSVSDVCLFYKENVEWIQSCSVRPGNTIRLVTFNA